MLRRLEISGFKSFSRKTILDFSSATTAIVGPNGSGKSNVAEAFRFALGEQSIKSMRGKRSEDLIFSGSHTSARSNRASVSIVFDNRKKIFPKLEYEEVTIERAVFRDGSSEYLINSTKVRLRDVQELLSQAHIGETGHHIISQGEADRILLASPRERRSMLEVALGLKLFEFKKQESLRKLAQTQNNVREVEALRREIAPHIKFLKKQVERIERAAGLRKELIDLSQVYLPREEYLLEREFERQSKNKEEAKNELTDAQQKLTAFDERTKHDVYGEKLSQTIREAEKELDTRTQERSVLSRELGRIEGSLESAKKRSIQVVHDPYIKISREDIDALKNEIETHTRASESASEIDLRVALKTVQNFIQAFFLKFIHPDDGMLLEEEQLVHSLENERDTLLSKEVAATSAIEKAREGLLKAREASMAHEETGREERHLILSLAEKKAHAEAVLSMAETYAHELSLRSQNLERERFEILGLAGAHAVTYEKYTEDSSEDNSIHEERSRMISRLKIRVEEAGGGGDDVLKEYTDSVKREEFLIKELEDLEKSSTGLQTLIQDLDTELSQSFTTGLEKVNESFSEFFKLMFGGGSASLVLEEISAPLKPDEILQSLDDDSSSYEEVEDEEPFTSSTSKNPVKQGIEISVHLPKKKVQALMQLSGGERALTSIALIFAMSQVNPPPFLILDETDAALDEANSRRYGDMIEALSKKSQLIVISHNRETMGRAGILYGVTMGSDGISKLLSVKFEEAIVVAK
jgi:chromosome segregation ATPase